MQNNKKSHIQTIGVRVRTCVSCKKKAEKSAFIRIVGTPKGEIKINKPTTVGRGMYLCKKKDCIEKAFRQKGKNAIQYHFKKKFKEILQDIHDKEIEKELLRIIQS
ncbi:YlxR family protein [Candidatus Peregrinibacteria bacterium]|nr:YlxR family protein [Candidatus Peregrinibacteria bacterium]